MAQLAFAMSWPPARPVKSIVRSSVSPGLMSGKSKWVIMYHRHLLPFQNIRFCSFMSDRDGSFVPSSRIGVDDVAALVPAAGIALPPIDGLAVVPWFGIVPPWS